MCVHKTLILRMDGLILTRPRFLCDVGHVITRGKRLRCSFDIIHLLCVSQMLTQALNRVTASSNLFENVTKLHLPGEAPRTKIVLRFFVNTPSTRQFQLLCSILV